VFVDRWTVDSATARFGAVLEALWRAVLFAVLIDVGLVVRGWRKLGQLICWSASKKSPTAAEEVPTEVGTSAGQDLDD
jgi:hypothetical protein